MTELRNITVGDLLDEVASQFPSNEALVNIPKGERFTYQIEYVLKQSDSRYLIMAEGLKGSEYMEMIQQLWPEINDSTPNQRSCHALPELKGIVLISDRNNLKRPKGMLAWEEVVEKERTFLIRC